MATIIKHKQFNNHIYKTEIAGRPFSLEFGKGAELANASAMVKHGDTSGERASPPCPPSWPPGSSTGPSCPCSPETSATTWWSPAPS